jgi:hypothetical protein
MSSNWDWGPEAFAAIAESVTALGVIFAIAQIKFEQQRSREQAALNLLMGRSHNRPANSRLSMKLMAALDQEQFEALLERREIQIDERQGQLACACFSNHGTAEIEELIANGKITPKGAALLGKRANRILDEDESMAIAINRKVADSEMILDGVRNTIDKDVKTFIDKYNASSWRKQWGEKIYYPALVEFFKHHPPHG